MLGASDNPVPTSSPAWLVEELAPRHLARSLGAGALLYVLEIILIVSFATLIFSGKLTGSLPSGLPLLLVGDAVLCGMTALLSAYAGSIAVAQETSAVMIAVISGTTVVRLQGHASSTQETATVVLLIVLTTVATGLFFLLLGIFNVGGLVRFMPYPVMGGFLAGTGWLLFVGGLAALTPLTAAMVQPVPLLHWLPALALGTVLLLATRHISHPLVLPGLIVGAVALFYLAALVTGTPFSKLSAEGWLLGPFPASSQWQFPLQPGLLSQVNWPELFGQAPAMASVLVVSVLAALLNVSGLELTVKTDIDLNRELVITGLGNLGAGIAGGLIGYNAISMSRLNSTLSGGRRTAGLVAGLLVGLTAVVGIAALGHAPRLVLGALLIYLGLEFLWEWVYRAWFQFPLVDYLIVVLILAVIAVRGFLAGIVIGLVLTIILFVVNYSRVDVIRNSLSGLTYRSRVRRNRAQQEILDCYGDSLYVLTLHGFIFFGTANSLVEQFRARLSQAGRRPMRFVVLDFAQVTGLDSTGLLSFSKMHQLAQDADITMVLTGLHGRLHGQFLHGGFGQATDTRLFPDLDRGVEWCESQIVSGHLATEEHDQNLTELLVTLVPASPAIQRLTDYLRREEVAAGECLIKQGDVADRVFFIESGQVSTYLESPDGEPVRLETMRGGRVVGELAFYLRIPRSATVVVDESATVYSLSLEQLARIESIDPAAAEVFHHIMAQLLADRVVHLMTTVEALQK